MKNKTETALIAIIIVITALFVANFTILFKIHDDQQIIKNNIKQLSRLAEAIKSQQENAK